MFTRIAFAALVCLVAFNSTAQTVEEKYARDLSSRQELAVLSGNGAVGESVSLYNGALSLSHTDVSIPGNSALPVAVSRYYVPKQQASLTLPPIRDFADWALDIPRVEMITAELTGWTHPEAANPQARCSVPSGDFETWSLVGTFGVPFEWKDFFGGINFIAPGGSKLAMIQRGSSVPAPEDGALYPWVAAGGWVFRCVPLAVGSGEGFAAISTDGTVIRFDRLIQASGSGIRKYDNLMRKTGFLRQGYYALMPSEMSDRFGNWVRYEYTSSTSANVKRIYANDGREINIARDPSSGDITSVDANGQVWDYSYYQSTEPYSVKTLDTVENPDGSRWDFGLGGISGMYIWFNGSPSQTEGPEWGLCYLPEHWNDGGGAVAGTVKAPSGLVATITVERRLQIANYGGSECLNYSAQINGTASVASITYSGPGLSTTSWTYQYPVPPGGWEAVDCGAACPTEKVVRVNRPDGAYELHHFGARYASPTVMNAGDLLRTEVRSSSGALIEDTTYERILDGQGMPYPSSLGANHNSALAYSLEGRHRPLFRKKIKRDGVTYTYSVCTTQDCWDRFARPLKATKSNSGGYSKLETTTYHDNLSKWILGQVATTAVNGVQVARTDYTPVYALPLRTYSFGKLQQTLGYTTTTGVQDGTLRTVRDGRNNVTTFTSWHRGIPRSINYADGTSQSAVVNANGTIASVTDENGFKTSYAYDTMGRLTKTTYPSGDNVAWAPMIQSFQQVASMEYGIPAGHWRKSVQQGSYRGYTYYDALWRPLLTREFDNAAASTTSRFRASSFDSVGRTTFASYPTDVAPEQSGSSWYVDAVGATAMGLATEAQPMACTPYPECLDDFPPDPPSPSPQDLMAGTHTSYDGLGRVTQSVQDSELGPLTTTTEYLSGFQTRITNPRNQPTLIRYQAYDQPSTDMPERIVQPEGAYTYITRNAFGQPTRITRRNAANSVAASRYYVYDAHQQLCKRLEPETGATVKAYDAAGNLAWSAGGQNLPSTTACDTASVATAARVTRGYDPRNRLTSLSFFDGNGNQLWDYTPDGLPEQITTYNNEGSTAAVNAYTYNKRRLLTGESLAQGSQYSWGVGYGYNSLGHLTRHTYPHGLTVDYAPNALGQPTKSGTYATGVSYYPNGAIAGFTYGNGIVHSLEQNERGLPERSRDAYGSTPVHDDSYDYDRNGNVLGISDARSGARGNRDMTYDGLDRLKSTTSPMFSPASYTYDVLDNLQTVKVAGRDHSYHYLNQQLINVKDVTSGASVIGLGYDAQGNLSNKNGVLYDFDYGNRLREVVGKESYRYDGHGRRIQATLPSGRSIYSMYGNDGVLRYQEDYRKGEATNYVYLGGSLVAEVANTKQATLTPVISAPATSNDGSYTVSWTASSGATRYVLDESINGGNWLQIDEGAGTNWSVTGKTDASYRYRVRACAMECSGYSTVKTVTVALIPKGAPALSAPAYDADGDFMVNWTAVPLAARYELREQVNSGVWAEIKDTPDLFADITGRAPGIYGYRVRACNPVGCADWNGPGTVTVYVQVRPNQVPTLTVPQWGPNGAYTIRWSASDGATEYLLEERFESGAWTEAYHGGSRSKPFAGRPVGTYTYRVAACNPAGCTGTSTTDSVEVVYTPTAAPTLTAPSQNTDGSYTVSWTAVATATSYKLEESTNSGTWKLIHNAAARSKALSGKVAGNHRYRVRACNAAGCGPLSAIKATVEIDPPSGVPTLTAPALVTNGSSYTVSWNGVATATAFRLYESANGGSWIQLQYNAAHSRAISGKGRGSYRYRVRACNAAGCSGYSSIKTTRMVYKPASAPVLTVPSSSGTGNYTISWSAVPTTTEYHLYERPVGGSWVRIHKAASRIKSIGGKSNGTYQYLLRACNEGGCGPDAPVKSITVLKPPPTPGGLWVEETIGFTCVADWNSAPGATSYQLRMGTSVVYNGPNRYWSRRGKCAVAFRVKACNASGCSAWSAPVFAESGPPNPLAAGEDAK